MTLWSMSRKDTFLPSAPYLSSSRSEIRKERAKEVVMKRTFNLTRSLWLPGLHVLAFELRCLANDLAGQENQLREIKVRK